MELTEFIKNSSQILQKSEKTILLFQSLHYSHNFFFALFQQVKQSLSQDYTDFKIIDIQSGDFAYKVQLETSFLGTSCVYFLQGVWGLKAKQKDDFLTYLAGYKGPHKVIVFIDTKTNFLEKLHTLLIKIKDKYFFEDAKKLWVVNDFDQAEKLVVYLQQLYSLKQSFSLDELFLLKNYQMVISKDEKDFYESWANRLVLPDNFLYMLSQLLFEKKVKEFLRLWFELKDLYSEMFWISFWSDQLYRAYFFIFYTQQENFAAAKQVSFGLSFLFIKQTYKHYQLLELQNFHNALFAVDSSLKNGGNVYQIDQLYINFFASTFKK